MAFRDFRIAKCVSESDKRFSEATQIWEGYLRGAIMAINVAEKRRLAAIRRAEEQKRFESEKLKNKAALEKNFDRNIDILLEGIKKGYILATMQSESQVQPILFDERHQYAEEYAKNPNFIVSLDPTVMIDEVFRYIKEVHERGQITLPDGRIGVPTKSGYVCQETFFARLPAHVAVENGNFEILKHLKAKGAPFEHVDSEGNTLLHKAILKKQYDQVVFLVDSGLSLFDRNYAGVTSMDLLLAGGHAKLLSRYRAVNNAVCADRQQVFQHQNLQHSLQVIEGMLSELSDSFVDKNRRFVLLEQKTAIHLAVQEAVALFAKDASSVIEHDPDQALQQIQDLLQSRSVEEKQEEYIKNGLVRQHYIFMLNRKQDELLRPVYTKLQSYIRKTLFEPVKSPKAFLEQLNKAQSKANSAVYTKWPVFESKLYLSMLKKAHNLLKQFLESGNLIDFKTQKAAFWSELMSAVMANYRLNQYQVQYHSEQDKATQLLKQTKTTLVQDSAEQRIAELVDEKEIAFFKMARLAIKGIDSSEIKLLDEVFNTIKDNYDKIIKLPDGRQLINPKAEGISLEAFLELKPVHEAAKRNKVDVLQYFAGRGIDLDQPDLKDETPLLTAARVGSKEAITYLVTKQKADLLKCNSSGLFPLSVLEMSNLSLYERLSKKLSQDQCELTQTQNLIEALSLIDKKLSDLSDLKDEVEKAHCNRFLQKQQSSFKHALTQANKLFNKDKVKFANQKPSISLVKIETLLTSRSENPYSDDYIINPLARKHYFYLLMLEKDKAQSNLSDQVDRIQKARASGDIASNVASQSLPLQSASNVEAKVDFNESKDPEENLNLSKQTLG